MVPKYLPIYYGIICIYVLIFLIYHILGPYKICQIKIIQKIACIKRHKQKINPYFSTSKVHYYIFGAYMSQFSYVNVFFNQVDNLNIITNLISWVSPKWRGWYLCKPILRWLKVWLLEDHSKSWIPTLSTLLRSPFYKQGMNKWKIIMFFYRRKTHKDKNTHGNVELKRQCL
jgi:hypothetical protein